MSSEEQWKVLGDLRPGGIDGELVIKQEDLVRITVAELRSALVSQADFYGRNYAEAKIFSVPEVCFDEEDGPFELMNAEDGGLNCCRCGREEGPQGEKLSAVSEV